MIKEALQYVVGLNKAEIIEVNNSKFSDKRLDRIPEALRADCLKFTTLQSIVTYIKEDPDHLEGQLILHVESPTCVKLLSQLDQDRERENTVVTKANIPVYPFGEFIDSEKFIIYLQSAFIRSEDNDDINKILKFAGTAEAGTLAKYGDDGVSQKVTIKTGITQVADDIIPNPVTLRPYRTFTEVTQPESQFIFRMKDGRECLLCGLYEADGGAWNKVAMDNIKDYLTNELSNISNVIVIS